MSKDLHEQIYENLNLKDTDELLEIWQTNNRGEWSDVAFDIVREILTKRIGELPPQNEPVTGPEKEEKVDELGLEEWEAKLIDNESQPDFYDTLEVIEFRKTINKVAIAVVVLNIVSAVFEFSTTKQLLQGIFPTLEKLPSILLAFTAMAIAVGISILIYYYPLKALAHILRILMQMEFNSRK
jgi:hypothetical protein